MRNTLCKHTLFLLTTVNSLLTWRWPIMAETCRHRRTNKLHYLDSCVLMDLPTIIWKTLYTHGQMDVQSADLISLLFFSFRKQCSVKIQKYGNTGTHITVMASFKICHRPSEILKSLITSETMLVHDPKIYNTYIWFYANIVSCATSATSPASFGTII
jgi:hypothetical protein